MRNAISPGEFRFVGRVNSGMPLVDLPDDELAALTKVLDR
jgi:hypothetical protein